MHADRRLRIGIGIDGGQHDHGFGVLLAGTTAWLNRLAWACDPVITVCQNSGLDFDRQIDKPDSVIEAVSDVIAAHRDRANERPLDRSLTG